MILEHIVLWQSADLGSSITGDNNFDILSFKGGIMFTFHDTDRQMGPFLYPRQLTREEIKGHPFIDTPLEILAFGTITICMHNFT